MSNDGVAYTKDTDYTVSYSDNINAGMAKVTVTPKEGSLLLGDAVTKEFTIAKATPKITLNVPSGEALVYDGKAKEVTATVEGVDNETVDLTASVAYYSDDTYQTKVEEAMNAGTYYVKASFAETTNYMAMEETASFTITQADNEWTTALSMDGWTYGEEAKKPTAVAKFGTPIFTYSNEENGTYTTKQPVNAGTWYVKATVEGTDNYTGLSKIKEFTIAKAEAPEDGNIGPAEGTDKEIHIYSDQSTFSLSVVAHMESVGKWVWEVTEGTDVADITNVEAQQLKAAGNESEGNKSKATFKVLGTGTVKITATYMNNNYKDYSK